MNARDQQLKRAQGEVAPQHFNESKNDFEFTTGSGGELHVKDKELKAGLDSLKLQQEQIVTRLDEGLTVTNLPSTQNVHDDQVLKELQKLNANNLMSITAYEKSVEALDKSQSTEQQLNAVIERETDSDAMSRQAAINAAGVDKQNLKARLDEDYNKVTQQLADMSKYENQIDYVDILQRNMQFNAIQFKVRNAVSKDFEVSLKYGNNRHIAYLFSRNNNVAVADDYIIQNEGYVGKSELFTRKNYDSSAGVFITAFPPNHYTTEVGATVTIAFMGTGIDFTHNADNRGGLWEFTVNGADKIKISTYTSQAAYTKTVTLFKDLTYKSHIVVGTFLGDDPNHVPSGGAGTSRGWLSYGDDILSTFSIHNGRSVTTNERSILQPYSNKEFAWSLKKLGSTSANEFFPTHGVKTAFNVESEQVFVDGKLIDLNLVPAVNIEGANSFKLVQHVHCKHPDFPSTPLINLVTIHSINLSGVVEVTCKAKFLEDTEIANGYVGMFPLVGSFVKELKTSLKNTYPTIKADGSRTNLTEESDKVSNYLALTDAYKQYGAAIRFNDIKSTLRQGATDKYIGTMWLEHRATGLQKLYPQIFRDSIMSKGTTFDWSLSYTIAEIPNLYDIV